MALHLCVPCVSAVNLFIAYDRLDLARAAGVGESHSAMLVERADFAELDALAAHRQRCWERQRDYVLATSPLHRRAWAGVEPPRQLEALAELPLIDKEMLRASQRASPPFGDYLAAPLTTIARVHRTSGTTGRR